VDLFELETTAEKLPEVFEQMAEEEKRPVNVFIRYAEEFSPTDGKNHG
jgi:hypothetical protein